MSVTNGVAMNAANGVAMSATNGVAKIGDGDVDVASAPTDPNDQDWHMSDFHSITIAPVPKARKQAVYARWAPTFDTDVNAQTYSSPAIIADKLSAMLPAAGARVVDMACGTGLVAPPLVHAMRACGVPLHLSGVDYSREMLDEARRKDVYDRLVLGDVALPLDVEARSVDAVIAAGLFVSGLCGPAVFPNLVTCLRDGGVAMLTVRIKTFDEQRAEYDQAFVRADMQVVERFTAHYLGPIDAYYIVLKKKT